MTKCYFSCPKCGPIDSDEIAVLGESMSCGLCFSPVESEEWPPLSPRARAFWWAASVALVVFSAWWVLFK